MSDTTVPRRSPFGHQIRQELDRRGLSIRALARRLDPERPDVARRNIARWIGGYNNPSRLSRVAVARALDLPDDHFLEDDDGESRTVTLDTFLRLRVREILREETARVLERR